MHGKKLAIHVARPKILHSVDGIDFSKWWFQIKFDGVRALWSRGKFWSRSGKLLFRLKIPLADGCEMDGELTGGMYNVFDLLSINGYSTMHWCIEDRTSAMLKIVHLCLDNGQQNIDPVFNLAGISDSVEFMKKFKFIKSQKGFEGIVLKRKGSTYPQGETELWRKFKGDG